MRKFLKKRFKNERGLTLVELLAVIVILAIIAVIAFVFIGGIIENSKKDAHISNAVQVIAAAKIYEAGGGDVTSGITVDKLVEGQFLEPLTSPWSKKTNDYNVGDAKVTKTEAENNNPAYYSISGFNDAGCNLGNEAVKEEDLLTKGRELCE